MICYKMRMLGSAIFIFFLCITGPLIPAVQQPAGGVTQAPELPVLPETVADFFRQPERAKELRHLELLLTVCKTTISYSLSRTVDQKDNPEEQGKISKHRYRLMILRDLINLSLGCCKYARDRNIGVGSFLLSLCEFYATYKIDFSKLTQRELSFHPIAELIELCSAGYATQSSVLSFEDYFKSKTADWLAIIARFYQRDQIVYKHLLASPSILFFLYNVISIGRGKHDDQLLSHALSFYHEKRTNSGPVSEMQPHDYYYLYYCLGEQSTLPVLLEEERAMLSMMRQALLAQELRRQDVVTMARCDQLRRTINLIGS